MSAKPVNMKKRAAAGQCRAMRCSNKEPDHKLYEFDTADPVLGVVLLCERHWRQASEHAQAPAPVGPQVAKQTVVNTPTGTRIANTATVDDVQTIDRTFTSTAVTIPHAPVLAVVEPMREEYTTMAAQLVGFVIGSQEQVDMAAELLKQIKGKVKKLEAQRKDITRPMLEAKAAVDALFRPAVDAAKSVEGMLKRGLSHYIDAQQKEQVAQLAAGNHEAGLAVPQPTMPSGVSTRTVWKWRPTNPDLIPREYWVIDAAKVQAHINAHKGQSVIPGVEVYCETGIAASAAQ